ncbi:MAG: hypothetical protein IMX00_10020 [Limnochordales bacterium]|nr:hypothetical protein [Limnochordales bacterium]
MSVHPRARVFVFPTVASFVGGDTVGLALAGFPTSPPGYDRGRPSIDQVGGGVSSPSSHTAGRADPHPAVRQS